LIAALIGLFSVGTMVSADAAAQESTPGAAPHKATKHVVKRKIVRRKKAAAAAKEDPILEGAEKWTCGDSTTFYLSGDMKRDQVMTLHWEGKNYKLPREQTTTGADRFHDLATGLDLVVIPFKAMLLSDRDDSRLADDCKDAEMATNGTPAPTQSNALIKTN
jgi:hypothetical protein